MNFLISYDDAKRLLQLFYENPYKVAAPYVSILAGLKAADVDMTLNQALEAELLASQQKKEESDQLVQDNQPMESVGQ